MVKFTPVAASVILLLNGTSQAQPPNKLQIETPPGVTVKITRRVGNTSTQILTTVNKQDTVDQTIIYPWMKVANEGAMMVIPTFPAKVRYGVTGFWIEKILQAGGPCTNEFFGGDPKVGTAKVCERFTGPFVVPPIAPPPPNMGVGLPIDISGLTFHKGIDYEFLSEPRPQNPVAQPGDWEKGGDLRTVCQTTKMAPDDPIVNPGQPGAAHMHTFFGLVEVDAFTTTDNIRKPGNHSTCRGGTINNSAYWVPTMTNTKTGKAIMPLANLVYYKTGFWPYMADGKMIQPLPPGLQMVAGDPKATGPTNRGTYGCLMQSLGYDRPVPEGKDNHQIPDWCVAGSDQMWAVVPFPQCGMLGVDGKPVLDSPDHRSHMAFPVFNDTSSWEPGRQYKCPDSHPVVYPAITFHIQYLVPADASEMKSWRLSSDVYDMTKPGGYTAHGDWKNGWNPVISDLWGKNCSQVRRDCGSHEVGDGRVAQEFDGN